MCDDEEKKGEGRKNMARGVKNGWKTTMVAGRVN
jgi:hypothetical protein